MENKQLPQQEPEDSRPEELTDISPEMEPQEDTPAIAELSFEAETHVTAEELPDAAEVPVPEILSDETDVSLEEPVPVAVPDPSFMDRIPDTDADYPAEAEKSQVLTNPEPVHEILPDDQAMDFHGMLDHGEAEPPFDIRILDDPELSPAPAEEANDQEYRDNGQDFDAMFQAPPAEEKKQELPRMPHKGRPKRKKGEGLLGIPNILVTIVWLALIVAIGVTAGRMLWVCAADVLAFGREDKVVTVTVYEADTMDQIIDKLYEKGLIRYKSLFKLYADISDAEEDIKPGIYDLNTRYDYHALVNFMSPRSSREVITLTIPEGYSCKQIFSLLEENRICTAVDLGAYAANGELNEYWFLENVERGRENSLEGFLFPDTYEFYKNSTPREALQKMLDNFNYRFTEEMRAQIELLNANVTGGGYTVQEVAIVASLIEKESAAAAESASIAGVIYNRLFNWQYPAFLNIDAAIVYAQGGDAENIDTKLDSPYNTYTNIGLPPTPIANPGLSSLQAALNPEAHNYYYYVLNPATGMHQFSTTQGEHDAWIAQFYN